ncbi:hypothetical protein D3C84_626420 [compost metagenome]
MILLALGFYLIKYVGKSITIFLSDDEIVMQIAINPIDIKPLKDRESCNRCRANLCTISTKRVSTTLLPCSLTLKHHPSL